MSPGELLGKLSAILIGLLFSTMAVLLWIGFAGLGRYPFALRLVLGLFILGYGAWRTRGIWRAGHAEGEN